MKSNPFLLLLFLFICVHLSAKQSLTIAWDTSLSMKDRNIVAELDFLSSYFIKYPETAVTVLHFNSRNVVHKKFEVKQGNWSAIKADLKKVSYDGATAYDKLSTALGKGTIFIFTDGKESILRDVKSLGEKPYLINSLKNCDLANLQFLALSNKGRFINLNNHDSKVYKKTLTPNYTGNIFSPLVALKNLTISIKDSKTKVKVKTDGTYSITGNPGDELVVTAFGETLATEILGENRILNLWIAEEAEQLDEVYLKKKREVAESEKAIETGLGTASKRSLGYATSSLDEEQIKGYFTLADALRGQFAGVNVGEDLGNVQMTGRLTSNLGTQNALVVIDGAPMALDTRVEGIVTPRNVASIIVLKGMAAASLYGTEGRNGVILITTKARAASVDSYGNKIEPKNLYQGEELVPAKSEIPNYIKELQGKLNLSERYEFYLKQRESYWSHPMYFSDMYEYFSNMNIGLGQQIAYNVLERDSSLDALRALLLTSYKVGHYQLALDIAYTLLTKYPQQTQSYLDLAMAHKAMNNHQEALNRLLAIENGTANSSLNFSELTTIADNEIRNLIADHYEELDLSNTSEKHMKKKSLKARIVIDWSNRDAEFVLTFINPDKRYSRWIHSMANPELIEKEVMYGFSQKEFEIDGGVLGEWVFNVNYLGNKIENSKAPTLLKCTIQHNYGTPQERTEQKVIKLYQEGSNEQLVQLITK
ncbi:MAG: TonB-dependent receptor plug domain-containing protein [Bacteroidetes bacterium]|nr:TonB-dependent receptor plug domain-containing protein [Bacteroidota bacterium]